MTLRSVFYVSLLCACSAAAHAAPPRDAATALQSRAAITYPLVVSFISIGSGVSPASVAQFNVVLAEFEATWGVSAQRTTASWGREGEFDVCFTLTDLPAAARAELVDQMWQLDAEPLIAVKENARCGW